MRDEFREKYLPKWENLIKSIFNGNVPQHYEWLTMHDIISILNTIGSGICQDSCHNSFKFFKTMKHPQYSLLYPQLCLQFYPQFFLFSLDLKTPYPLMTNF